MGYTGFGSAKPTTQAKSLPSGVENPAPPGALGTNEKHTEPNGALRPRTRRRRMISSVLHRGPTNGQDDRGFSQWADRIITRIKEDGRIRQWAVLNLSRPVEADNLIVGNEGDEKRVRQTARSSARHSGTFSSWQMLNAIQVDGRDSRGSTIQTQAPPCDPR
jgi:hypothetical protein